ncbi:NAD-dependent epimerase/dehydratase family protein [Actinokineospora globicatena]|uniref:NAD-dependent epimerase/dehydratase family protein n=1 Tax=Actinokineospora globicatena TaxID=103729 RepID=UPI0020A3D9EE|nr:NAD-dependent epimerase/dehydratase family protein [Actinokineospora globicatena]MCP2305953.1 Nucleoside-diphosphate-sugar epimerase [Actinokineospora globicatena]GLW80177.1 nucleoside-diphosphate sugar epimerase [Actinokineospora globicatena]GLW87006.1 nucleoside-diphosphate sugar epimerase [Actinokineospora globicatena]
MRVFAIGATGVLGQRLVPLLVGRGHDVVAMAPGDRLERLPGGVRAVDADLLDPGVTDVLTGELAGVDVVVNAATAIPRDFGAPGAWERNTQLRRDGTVRVLNAVLAAGVPAVVQMSVTMAYADGGDAWLTEQAPFDPDPARGSIVEPVAAMEKAVVEIGGDRVAWSILRGARFVGAGTAQDAIRARLKEGTLHAHPDDRYTSLVHVADFATAVVAAVERRVSGVVLNIADEPLLVADYLGRLAEHDGAPAPGTSTEAVREVSHRVSSAAARELLDWQPKTGVLPDSESPL